MDDLSPCLGGDDPQGNSPCLGGGTVTFFEAVNRLADTERERIEGILNRAQARDPYNEFVESCRTQFRERGFLTAKQTVALKRVQQNRYRGEWWQ